MKKVLWLLLVMFLFVSPVHAFDNDTTMVQKEVDGGYVKFIYTGLTVAAGESVVSRLLSYGSSGSIKEIWFGSASTDCDVFISEKDGVLVSDTSTILAISGINLMSSPELSMPRTFVNRDPTQTNNLYLTVEPTTLDTGEWTLILTYERF